MFLKIRGIKCQGLKKILQEKVLEILVEDDYKTICDIREIQIYGFKKVVPIENPKQKDNEKVTNTQNIPEANKILNKVPENLEECILIEDENPFEDDKTGLFYIKHKIFTQTFLLPTNSTYIFDLNDLQYLEILEGRYNANGILKFNVQLQLRLFLLDLNDDSLTPGAKIRFNGAEIPYTVRCFIHRTIFYI